MTLDGCLVFYDVPMLLALNDRVLQLRTREDVIAAVRAQVDGLRAAGYGFSETLGFETENLNALCALCRGRFLRRRRDGTELKPLHATYQIVQDRTVHGSLR